MIKSVMGCAIHTPVKPKKVGRKMMRGTSKISWRKTTNPIEILDCPMAWNRLGTVVARAHSGSVNK